MPQYTDSKCFLIAEPWKIPRYMLNNDKEMNTFICVRSGSYDYSFFSPLEENFIISSDFAIVNNPDLEIETVLSLLGILTPINGHQGWVATILNRHSKVKNNDIGINCICVKQ